MPLQEEFSFERKSKQILKRKEFLLRKKFDLSVNIISIILPMPSFVFIKREIDRLIVI